MSDLHSASDEEKKHSDGGNSPVKLSTLDQKSPDEEKGQELSQYDDVAVDLNYNPQGKIVNPLSHIPRATLLANVQDFAREKQLEEHVELLQRGALLAQDPANYGTIDDLSEDEKDAIEHELTHKWSHPLTLYLTIITCSIGAATQGECTF
jgi:hypothetical protein